MVSRMEYFSMRRHWILVFSAAFAIFEISKAGLVDDDTEEADLGEAIQYVDGDMLIAVFLPITGHDDNMRCNRIFRRGAMPEQVNMFLEKVNANDSILPGITLGAIVVNTCVSEIHTLRMLFLDILRPFVLGQNCTKSFCPQGKRILAGVVGAAHSAVSMNMAINLQIFEISQVSYWATATTLSNKRLYKYFFRTVPADDTQTLAMTDFIKKMEWNYVSVVYADDTYGVRGFQELSDYLTQSGICTAFTTPIGDSESDAEVELIIHRLLEHRNAKVVILFTTAPVASKVLSVASRVDKTNSLLWIASDGWAENLRETSGQESYINAAHGSIGFSLKFPPMDELNERVRTLTIQDYTGSNATLNPWWQDFFKYTKNCSTKKGSNKRLCSQDETIENYKSTRNGLEESMTVMVHAMHRYYKATCGNGRGLCFKLAKSAGTDKVAKDLYEYIKNVTFLTYERRMFRFDEDQDGLPLYNVVAFDKNRIQSNNVAEGWYEVGTYDGLNNVTLKLRELPDKVNNLNSICSEECKPKHAKIISQQTCCWVCQKCNGTEYAAHNACVSCPPHKMPNENGSGCVPIPIEQMEYHSGYVIACLTVGIFGIVCTVIVTIMYWINRDTAIVRASGRELCFLVLIGVFITLLNCFSITAPATDVSCAITRVVMAIGPAVMYAGLLMKTFRVVFIFQSKGILSVRTKGYLEPRPLIFLTLCVVLIQAILLSAWMVVNPPNAHDYYAANGVEAFHTCEHILDKGIFVGLAYPFLIIIVCTILATINRNVPTGFRETLFVGFTMYTTCVTWIAFQALFFIEEKQNNVERKLTTLSCALSISAITVLLCLFGPRCYTIIRHPELNTSEIVMSRNSNGAGNQDRAVPHEPIGTVSGALAGAVNEAYSTTEK